MSELSIVSKFPEIIQLSPDFPSINFWETLALLLPKLCLINIEITLLSLPVKENPSSNRKDAASFFKASMNVQETVGVNEMAILTTRKTTQVVQQNLLVYFPFSTIWRHRIAWIKLSTKYHVLSLSSKLRCSTGFYTTQETKKKISQKPLMSPGY